MCVCVQKEGRTSSGLSSLGCRKVFSTVLTRGCCPTSWLLSACLSACVCPKSKEAIITNSNSSVVFIQNATTIVPENTYFCAVPSISTFTT